MTREDYHATLSSLQEAMESNAAKTPHQRHLTVPIPSVDIGRCDPRNLIGVVKEKESNGLL